ncbi:MAG TPA: hypothetical protein VGO62_05060 [Myxococcota bacterium]|jgi:hypothetical protein
MRFSVVTASASAFATVLATVLALAACKTAPAPAAGAPAGSFCGSDLECDDGLVCTCGACSAPTSTDEPPACAPTTGCPPFPTACVESCTAPRLYVGDSTCSSGAESCASGVLESSCTDDNPECNVDGGAAPPAGFICSNEGTLDCLLPGNVAGNCLTDGCDGETPFLCVLDCSGADTPFDATCVNHKSGDGPLYACDPPAALDGGIGFAESACVDAGPDAGPPDAGFVDAGPDAGNPDAGPCGDDRPLCLFHCDPTNHIDAAACRPADGGGFDFSCAGFAGYTAADQCPVDAGPLDGGPVDAG